jgi:regulator of protease activity HflC (stomatin/prohibitin superfamily)
VASYLQGGDVRFIEMQSTEKQNEIEHRMIGEINKELDEFGIYIGNLKIERVTLPEAIAKKIEEIHKKALSPIEAQLDSQSAAIKSKQEADAAGQKIAAELRAYIDTLGPEHAMKLLTAKVERDATSLQHKQPSVPSPEINLRIGVDKS